MNMFTKKDAQKILSEARKIEEWGNYALIYANFETGEIWCNEYADENSFTAYADDSIYCIGRASSLALALKNWQKFKNLAKNSTSLENFDNAFEYFIYSL